MAALREMGLAVALLAATGGAAVATWSYFSARRRKAAARDPEPQHEGEKSAHPDTPMAPEGEPDSAPGAAGPSEEGSPAPQVGEDGAGPVPAADTPPRHEEGRPGRREEPAVPTVDTPPRHEEGRGGPPPVEAPLIKDTHSSAHTLPQVKTSPCKHVVVLGLDGSGKTSVLNSIASNKGHVVTTPTGGVNAMCLNDGNSKMEFLEIGGSEQLRPYWKMYLSKAFAIIFVVDAADHSRLPLAKRHLHQLIQQDAVLPLIVLANKQDLENAYHITEIHDALALSEICENRKLFLIGTHVRNSDSEISSGIQDTKEYLVQLFSEHAV